MMTTKILSEAMMATSAILLPAIVCAQEAADTVVARGLDEIVVEAPKVIRKADMDVYYPSRTAVGN